MKAENCSAIIRFFYLIECITLPTTDYYPPSPSFSKEAVHMYVE